MGINKTVKGFFIFFTACIMSFSLMGCGKDEDKKSIKTKDDNKTTSSTEDKTEKDETETEEIMTEDTTEDTTLIIDYEAVYEPVLKENYDAIVNGYDDEKEYKYLSTGVMEVVSYETNKNKLLESLGYIITDVSGDGIPELLIGENVPTGDYISDEEGYIYSGYTYKEGELICFLDGWARSNHRMTGDNDFYYLGSGGVMNTAFGEYHLSDDATEIIWDDFYFTEPNGDFTEAEYYHNKTGEYDDALSEKVDMTEDEFWNLLDKKPVAIDWITMRNYGGADSGNTSGGSTGNDDITDVSVDLSDVAATWLYPSGASLVIEENGNWTVYDGTENWLFSGEWNASIESDYIALTFKSEVGDNGNSQVGTGRFYYDTSGYPALDMQFELGLTDFSYGIVTLYKGM